MEYDNLNIENRGDQQFSRTLCPCVCTPYQWLSCVAEGSGGGGGGG